MTIILATESVDQSATYLSQALDGDLEISNGDIPESVMDEENNVIFYGALRLPERFHFNELRMFNNPTTARRLLNKRDVMDNLRSANIPAVIYLRANRDLSFTEACRILASRRLELVNKSGLQVVASVERANDYNAARRSAYWVRSPIDIVKKYRIFIGLPNLTNNTCLIGTSFTEKRMLTYRESLLHGQPAEAQRALSALFDSGRIPENAGQGHEAWTDSVVLRAENIPESDRLSLEVIASAAQNMYSTDFCALDIVGRPDGTLATISATACPSLEEEDVLHMVADYHREMLEFGRRITGDQLANMVRDLSEEHITQVVNFLRQNNLTGRARG